LVSTNKRRMMTEQQTHLENLIKQREELALALERTRETLLKVTGAIEYLTQTGVTLPEPEVTDDSNGDE
jgi:hypothetical protein